MFFVITAPWLFHFGLIDNMNEMNNSKFSLSTREQPSCPLSYDLFQSHYQASVKYFRLLTHLKTNERQFAARLKLSYLIENDLDIMQTKI